MKQTISAIRGRGSRSIADFQPTIQYTMTLTPEFAEADGKARFYLPDKAWTRSKRFINRRPATRQEAVMKQTISAIRGRGSRSIADFQPTIQYTMTLTPEFAEADGKARFYLPDKAWTRSKRFINWRL